MNQRYRAKLSGEAEKKKAKEKIVRQQILKVLLNKRMTTSEIKNFLDVKEIKAYQMISDLAREGFIIPTKEIRTTPAGQPAVIYIIDPSKIKKVKKMIINGKI